MWRGCANVFSLDLPHLSGELVWVSCMQDRVWRDIELWEGPVLAAEDAPDHDPQRVVSLDRRGCPPVLVVKGEDIYVPGAVSCRFGCWYRLRISFGSFSNRMPIWTMR